MNYFARTRAILQKRLPSFVGIFVLLFAVGLTVILSSNSYRFMTKATVGSVPKDMKITNITEDSFTVSFTTDESTLGSVAYGKESSLGEIALDIRDQQASKPAEHRVHYITIQNLQPSTLYYFTITSGAQVVSDDGKPYEVTTASPISAAPPANAVLSGSVALEDGTFPTEAVVYAFSDTSQKVSALLQPDGAFSIPLDKLRAQDLSSFLSLEKESKLKLQISDGALQSEATLLPEQATEVPKIVLSKNYDFTIGTDPLASPIASDSAQPLPASQSAGLPILDEPANVTTPEITTPTVDQEFKDQQPLFKGKALPSTPIEIVINSDKEISASLQSDSNGNWEFRPPVELEPGNHTITISSLDINGTIQKLTRSFTVNAAGSQFTEPSVSPGSDTSPAITPTVPPPTPTLEPSPTASPSPTIDISPTEMATISPTRGPLSETGSYTTAAGVAMSVLFIAGGVVLFFLIAV